MSNEAGKEVSVIDTYRNKLDRLMPEFSKALRSTGIDPGRFVRVAISVLQKADPNELRKASEKSVFSSIMQAAQEGLMLDGKEAALIVYDGVAQYQPMVRGILKLARNSGQVIKVVSQVVYENDDFDIQFVTDGPPIRHSPALDSRGRMLGVYAVAYLKDNAWTDPEWMTVDQVNEIRGRSFMYKRKKGAWLSDYEEMARKTVIKRAAKRWPCSTVLDDLLHIDDAEYSVVPDVEQIDHETGEVVSIAPPPRGSRTASVLQARKPAPSIAPPVAEPEPASEEGYQPPLAMPDDDFSLPGEHEK